ncbi:MAG: hypothetical protein WAL41_04845, partial [Mycobacterium sp.]
MPIAIPERILYTQPEKLSSVRSLFGFSQHSARIRDLRFAQPSDLYERSCDKLIALLVQAAWQGS